MATKKYAKLAAPYTSATLNTISSHIVGINGVLEGGAITMVGSTITIAPLTFIQNGLIVANDQPIVADLPGSIQPPYYIAVTTLSSVESLSELLTPIFVKRPADVSQSTVLIAEWDGTEIRPLPKVSIGSLLESGKNEGLLEGLVGITTGMDVTKDTSNLYVSPGAAHAADGQVFVKNKTTTLAKIAADSDGLDRIDEVVLRKALDNPTRIAALQYIPGPTFNSGGTVQLFSPSGIDPSAMYASQMINSTSADGDLRYHLWVDGSGNLKFMSFDSAGVVVHTPITISVGGVTQFCGALNPEGSIDIAFISGSNVSCVRISTNGAVLIPAQTLFYGSTTVSNVNLVTVTQGSSYYIHIVYQHYLTMFAQELRYCRLDSQYNISTAEQALPISGMIINPHLAKDDDDNLLFLVFEDSSTYKVYLNVYDASTATFAAPPAKTLTGYKGSSINLSHINSNSYYTRTSSTLITSGGRAKVVRLPTKEIFVFWLQFKSGGYYGVSVYRPEWETAPAFAGQSIVKDLFEYNENVSQFDVSVDGLGVAHLIMRLGSRIVAVNLRLSDLAISEPAEVLASGGTDCRIHFTSRGALIHTYASVAFPSGTFAVKSTAGTITTLRNRYLPPTDVYIAHYRTSDQKLSVAGNVLEEDPTVRRLYEFGNMYPSTGTVSWSGSATNILTINSAIKINFFNRKSTYTIPTNTPSGVNVPNGYVAYVQIPDDDSADQNLTLVVKAFGTGTLDRYNLTTVPIFWAVGGVLYTKFAPFRLDSGGEVIVIGESLNANQQAWLGMSGTNPNPASHSYSSTRIITQSTDYNAAIGLLDAQAGAAIDALPLRLYASTTPDAKLNIGPSLTSRPDGTGLSVFPIKHATPSVSASSINFQTQATAGATFQITWPVSTVGRYRRLALSVLSTGQIVGNFSAEVASVGLLPDQGTLYVSSGTSLGYIDLECTAVTPAFKTIGSASNIIENKVSGTARIVNLAGGGGGSTSAGVGAALSPDPGYQAVLQDIFDVGPADTTTKVYSTYTNATYDTTNGMYQLYCDKSRTVTATGTSYTLSGAPSFTVKVGDIIWVNSQSDWRRIATVTTQTTGTLDAAFSSNPSTAACMVSQAVWSKDLTQIGDAAGLTDELPFGTLYGATNFSSIHLEYDDSLVSGDPYADRTSEARVRAVASNSGNLGDSGLPLASTFANLKRPTFPSAYNDLSLLGNATKQRMFVAFFADPTNASVTSTANLIRYRVSFYAQAATSNGGFLNSAWVMTDGTGTPYNCGIATVYDSSLGKNVSEITTTWSFNQGINPGSPDGDIEVVVEGAGIYPRYFTGVVGDYWKEVSGYTNKIRFNNDLSVASLSVHIRRRQGSVDTSSTNTGRLTATNGVVVGSAAQVAAGVADYSSISAALAAANAGDVITVLKGTYVESVTMTRENHIRGQGYSTVVTGTWTISGTCNYASVCSLRFNGNVVVSSGATGNLITDFWIASSSSVTDSGTNTLYVGIQE